MENYIRKSNTEIAAILPRFESEDAMYRLLPKSWFEKSKIESILGCKRWYWSNGGSDCGKFCLRLLGKIAERYSEKYCQWGSSGGGSVENSVDERFEEHSDAPILAMCKYRRRDGKWHICCATVVAEAPTKPYFFERTDSDIRIVTMNKEEFDSIVYIRAY